jgi:multiple sugar transport system substrate-binding protein
MDRRSFIKTGLAVGTVSPFSGSIIKSAFAQDTELHLTWWGSQDRAKRTLAVAALFNKAKPGRSVVGEAIGADYFPKLTTRLVGRNLPDVFQLEPATLTDYARRSATLELDRYLGSTIRTQDLAPGTQDLGKVGGKVQGMPVSINAFSLFYDADAFRKVNMEPPKPGTTWDEIAKLSIELTKASGRDKFWGLPNASRYTYVFEGWLHQRGKLLFTADGKLGFNLDDAKAWYTYWDTLRKAGGCVAADIQATDATSIESNPLSLGHAAMAFTYSNQLVGYQLMTKSKLGLTTIPVQQAGGKSGLFYRPGLLWSIGKTSKNPDMAAQFIDFFINDMEAGKILSVERGVPVNLKIRQAIAPQLSDVERATVTYIDSIAGLVSPYPPPAPVGFSEFDSRVMRLVADELAFGRLNVADAANKLIADGNRAIRA